MGMTPKDIAMGIKNLGISGGSARDRGTRIAAWEAHHVSARLATIGCFLACLSVSPSHATGQAKTADASQAPAVADADLMEIARRQADGPRRWILEAAANERIAGRPKTPADSAPPVVQRRPPPVVPPRVAAAVPARAGAAATRVAALPPDAANARLQASAEASASEYDNQPTKSLPEFKRLIAPTTLAGESGGFQRVASFVPQAMRSEVAELAPPLVDLAPVARTEPPKAATEAQPVLVASLRPQGIEGRTLLGAAAPISRSAVQALPEYLLKAAFLYNFAVQTQWPESVGARVQLCIFGDGLFGSQIVSLNGKPVGGRSLQVRLKVSLPDLDNCQVVFVPSDAAAWLAKVRDKLRGQAALLVAEHRDALSEGAALNLNVDDEGVTFEASPAAARRSGLVLNAQLLKLAQAVQN